MKLLVPGSRQPPKSDSEKGWESTWLKAPESMMAAWKRPRLSGATMCSETDVAPALSPKMVTRSGSPPNAPIDFLTLPAQAVRRCELLMPPAMPVCDGAGMGAGMAYHCSARVWSWMP